MESAYFTCDTAFGWLAVAVSDAGLVALSWPAESPAAAAATLGLPNPHEIAPGSLWGEVAHKLQAYFQGQRVAFAEEPIDWRGLTPLRQRIWQAVRAIPWGTTRSYGEIAAAVGVPRAARAVGGAMAANRLPIIIPCHRVLGSDGRLVGFAGGLETKARLLAMEGLIS